MPTFYEALSLITATANENKKSSNQTELAGEGKKFNVPSHSLA